MQKCFTLHVNTALVIIYVKPAYDVNYLYYLITYSLHWQRKIVKRFKRIRDIATLTTR